MSGLALERAKDIVLDAATRMNENGVVVLESYAPFSALQEIDGPNFVVFPSLRGGWNIQTVPSSENPQVGRVPFPEEWLGNPDKSLGMTFCHPGNFLASTETKEQAIEVANIAVEQFLELTMEEDMGGI